LPSQRGFSESVCVEGCFESEAQQQAFDVKPG